MVEFQLPKLQLENVHEFADMHRRPHDLNRNRLFFMETHSTSVIRTIRAQGRNELAESLIVVILKIKIGKGEYEHLAPIFHVSIHIRIAFTAQVTLNTLAHVFTTSYEHISVVMQFGVIRFSFVRRDDKVAGTLQGGGTEPSWQALSHSTMKSRAFIFAVAPLSNCCRASASSFF